VSEQALAWGMTMILAAMIHPPPDDDPEKMKWLPTFTGAQPYFRTNPGDLRVSQELAMPAMSIRIGNQFWDYSRLEPFASILPWIHEIIHVGSSGRNGVPTREALRDSMSVLGQAVSDKNFTGAMGDLIQATMDPDNAERYAANMFASFAMPNIVRSVIRAKDKEVLSAAPKGERGTMERLASLAGNTAYSMTGASAFKPAPKVDYFGRTVTKTGPGATPLTDFLYRLFKITMPSSAKVGDSFKYTRMIYAWNGTERYRWMKEYPNATKVTSELGLTQPQSFLSFKAGGYDQKHYLSSEEYEQYSRLIGQIFLGKLDHVRFNYDKPTPRDIAVFRKLHDDSTEQAGRIMKNMLKKDGVIP
jgi:hypothetical protein